MLPVAQGGQEVGMFLGGEGRGVSVTFLGVPTERAERDAGTPSCCKLLQEDEVPRRTQEASHVSPSSRHLPWRREGPPGQGPDPPCTPPTS